jgi:hypothetical protein
VSDLLEFKTRSPVEVNIDMHQIRYLARQIETPEQFEEIMKKTQAGPMRAKVRELLIPLLPFKL